MARPRGPRPAALFHGTNVELSIGDRVLPSAVSGAVQAHPRPERTATAYDAQSWAHATSNENVAWQFAERAAARAHRGSGVNGTAPAPGGTGRARVYRLEPEGQLRHGLEHRSNSQFAGFDHDEYVAKAFRVVGREDIEPPSSFVYADGEGKTRAGYQRRVKLPNVAGTQGTLPVDWTETLPGVHPSLANHPMDGHLQTQREIERLHPKPVPPEPRQEIPGQETMFSVPKVTGRAQARRLAKLRGPR